MSPYGGVQTNVMRINKASESGSSKAYKDIDSLAKTTNDYFIKNQININIKIELV